MKQLLLTPRTRSASDFGGLRSSSRFLSTWRAFFKVSLLALVATLLSAATTWAATVTPPPGWYAGDMHVHRNCGAGPLYTVTNLHDTMVASNLSVISLLADMGNGEVQNPVTDLPLVTGADDPVSTLGRIVHWDAEWHWDATYTQYPHQALGGHIVALGLTNAQPIWRSTRSPSSIGRISRVASPALRICNTWMITFRRPT